MNKLTIGLMVVVAFLLGGLFTLKVKARDVQDLATKQQVLQDPSTYRFEWFSDVCYVTHFGGSVSGDAISCFKK